MNMFSSNTNEQEAMAVEGIVEDLSTYAAAKCYGNLLETYGVENKKVDFQEKMQLCTTRSVQGYMAVIMAYGDYASDAGMVE